MKRLLLISPHFPPDASAGAHRARVLAPYLEAAGWRPTVLSVEAAAYAGAPDHELGAMLPHNLEVIRAAVARPDTTRRLGFGDLGLRSLPGLWREGRRLTNSRAFDAVFITTYPVYPALLGPRLRARTGAPLIIDLQDPWTGAWGQTVGGAADGGPDLRSRLSRRVMGLIEQHVLPACDAITGVSTSLLKELQDRYPVLKQRPTMELPIGLDPRDLDWVRAHPTMVAPFDRADGNFHLCSVGTLLPLAVEPLRAVFSAVKTLCASQPEIGLRLRLHFIGTSNQADSHGAARVLPIAHEYGVAPLVTEHPPRIPFADALRVQLAASALLVLGSTEARYTASKVAPVIATGRPVLVVAHRDSDITRAMQQISAVDRGRRVVSFGDDLGAVAGGVGGVLEEWLTAPPGEQATPSMLGDFEGPALAQKLAGLLDAVVMAPA